MPTSLFFSGLTIIMLIGDVCLMGFQASEIQETGVGIHPDVMCA